MRKKQETLGSTAALCRARCPSTSQVSSADRQSSTMLFSSNQAGGLLVPHILHPRLYLAVPHPTSVIRGHRPSLICSSAVSHISAGSFVVSRDSQQSLRLTSAAYRNQEPGSHSSGCRTDHEDTSCLPTRFVSVDFHCAEKHNWDLLVIVVSLTLTPSDRLQPSLFQ